MGRRRLRHDFKYDWAALAPARVKRQGADPKLIAADITERTTLPCALMSSQYTHTYPPVSQEVERLDRAPVGRVSSHVLDFFLDRIQAYTNSALAEVRGHPYNLKREFFKGFDDSIAQYVLLI